MTVEPLTRTQCATRFGVSARFGKYSTCMHFAFWQVQYAFWPVLVDCMQMHGTRGTAHAWHNGFPHPPVTPAHLTHVELLRLPPLTSFAHSQSSAIALEPTSNPPDEEVLDDRAWVDEIAVMEQDLFRS